MNFTANVKSKALNRPKNEIFARHTFPPFLDYSYVFPRIVSIYIIGVKLTHRREYEELLCKFTCLVGFMLSDESQFIN